MTTESEDVALLSTAARAAGALALTYFRNRPKTWAKGETSIVSEADLAVDRLLAEQLRAARPHYGWLSEETAGDGDGLDRDRVFVVDPIDGTRGFLAGETEWTVSLAVVVNGRPVAAALYAPALDIMFTAAAGAGATRNDVPLRASDRAEIAGAHLAGSRRLVREILEATTIRLEYRGFIPSLAYRFALVAAGEVDVAVARPGAYDWDLAACDLLVHEAGGQLAGLDGEPPRYVSSDARHPLLLAAAPALGREITALVAGIERGRTD